MHRAMAIDDELISFGDAAENVRVVEDQAVALGVSLLVEKHSGR